MLKIRRPLGRLIFNMGITIPGKTVFLIETAPCYWQPINYEWLIVAVRMTSCIDSQCIIWVKNLSINMASTVRLYLLALYIPSNVWDEMSYPFPKRHHSSWEWNYFNFTLYNECQDYSYYMILKCAINMLTTNGICFLHVSLVFSDLWYVVWSDNVVQNCWKITGDLTAHVNDQRCGDYTSYTFVQK